MRTRSSRSRKDIKSKPALWRGSWYYLVPALISILQLVYILASNTNIREEELAESVRNVFWLDHRLLYDGTSSNVGYYGLLLVVYKILGFSIHTAKYVRLILYVAAMYSLAVLLQKFLNKNHAALALVTIGLSPTILFFNTIQTSYGMDILYGIICLLIILNQRFDGSLRDLSLASLLGFIAILASMSYPSFIFYLPSLAFIYLWRWRKSQGNTVKKLLSCATFTVTGFIVPLLGAFYYLKDSHELINDPVTHSGLFRGGGTLQLDMSTLMESLYQTIADIFYEGGSYYYYVQAPDFSGPLIWIAVAVILALVALIAVKSPSFRPVVFLTSFHILFNLILPGFASTPGIRRSTGFLVGIYGCYVIVLCGLFIHSDLRKIKWIGLAACLLITVSNLIAYATNIETISSPTPYSEVVWFAVEDTPSKSLQHWLDATKNGITLTCVDATGARVPCQYAKIYAAIAGFRKWNGLPEVPVRGYDWNKLQGIILTVDLWESYYFLH